MQLIGLHKKDRPVYHECIGHHLQVYHACGPLASYKRCHAWMIFRHICTLYLYLKQTVPVAQLLCGNGFPINTYASIMSWIPSIYFENCWNAQLYACIGDQSRNDIRSINIYDVIFIHKTARRLIVRFRKLLRMDIDVMASMKRLIWPQQHGCRLDIVKHYMLVLFFVKSIMLKQLFFHPTTTKGCAIA